MSRKALAHLKRVDPVLGKVIEQIGPYRLRLHAEGSHFDHVVRAIIFQQLSGKAASTIHGRVKGHFGGNNPTPKQILDTSDGTFRSLGVSRQKLSYLRDLAHHVASGSLPIDSLHELGDDLVIERLTQVKGIGRWTAQMFLMFRLGRLNVLPTVDLGINKALMKAYKLKKMPTGEQVLKLGAAWSPFATVACWYLWRFIELKAKDDKSTRPLRPRKRKLR